MKFATSINPSVLPEGHAESWATGLLKLLRSGYDVWMVGPGHELAKEHLRRDRNNFKARERRRFAKRSA